jgi:hypothetical protein
MTIVAFFWAVQTNVSIGLNEEFLLARIPVDCLLMSFIFISLDIALHCTALHSIHPISVLEVSY